jgi:hypothetical protein
VNILARLDDEWRHARIVYRIHDRIIELQGQFDRADLPVNRAVFAMQIAGRQESQADHLAASWLARAVTALPSPDVLRDDARRWNALSDELFAEAAKGANR